MKTKLIVTAVLVGMLLWTGYRIGTALVGLQDRRLGAIEQAAAGQ